MATRQVTPQPLILTHTPLCDAARRGSRSIQPDRYIEEGWPLGMAAVSLHIDPSERLCDLAQRFPFLNADTTAPCGCDRALEYGRMTASVVAHLWDAHVFGAGDWTPESVLRWLESEELAAGVRNGQ